MSQGLNRLELTEEFSIGGKCSEYLVGQTWQKVVNSVIAAISVTKMVSKQVLDYVPSANICNQLPPVPFYICLNFLYLKRSISFYTMSCNKKRISIYELSRKLCLRQETYFFQKKVQEATRSSGSSLLNETKEVDKFLFGGIEAGKTGWVNEMKRLAVMALLVDAFEIYRYCVKVVSNATSDELRVFRQGKIAPVAKTKIDRRSGYTPSKVGFPNLEQEKSNKGIRHPLCMEKLRCSMHSSELYTTIVHTGKSILMSSVTGLAGLHIRTICFTTSSKSSLETDPYIFKIMIV